MLGTAVVVMKALTRNGKITLISPSNPPGVGEVGPSAPGEPAETVATKSELTRSSTTGKNSRRQPMETPPSRFPTPKIKISQLNTNLEDLPIMQTHLLAKLLTTAELVPRRMRGISRFS